jgi:polysaccharide export outer membrane protein
MIVELMASLVLLGQAATATAAAAPAVAATYKLGPSDVVVINVLGQTTLSGRYHIGEDGTFEFPLIGRVEAEGKDAVSLEQEIVERLGRGYLRKPQVSVSVAEYASQRVFVIGEVRLPGSVPVTGGVTLLGLIARAGGLTDMAGGELVVVRSEAGARAAGPSLPAESGTSVVFRASVRDFRTGALARNERLQAGDTIFVPRAQAFQVLGQVRAPGSFVYESGMTVLRALSLAGGATELGAVNRLRILRDVDGKQQELRAKYEDRLEPGDTIFVPTRRW